MKVEVSYLKAHPLSGMLYYRRVFPEELRPHILENGRSRTELKVSLGARSLNEPGAMARHDAVATRYDALVANARKIASAAYDRLDVSQIRYLADNFLHHHLALDEASRFGEPSPAFPFETRRDYEADYLECREMLNDYDGAGLLAYWQDWATSYTRALGYTYDPSTPAFAALCRSLGEASCRLWLALDKRIDGRGGATPEAPTAPEAIGGSGGARIHQAAPAGPSRSFEAIAKELMVNPRLASTFTPGVADHVRTALRFIRETLGTPSPAELTRAAVSSVLDLMAQRPVKLPAAERDLGLPELARLYQGQPGVRRMSPRTQEVRMSSMSTLWKMAIKEGPIPDEIPNPFVGREYAKTPWRQKTAIGFSAEELTSYFSLPPFQEGARPVRGRGEAIFWLPLIAMFTGARPEEVAQLLVADIHTRELDGRWVVRFTDEGTHPLKGPQTLKTAKYESGRRTFPVPQALLDLGLPQYLNFLRREGSTALFPLLRLKGRRGDLYSSFGGWFGDYLYDNGVLSRGTGRQPVREFRHTWTTAARASGIARDAREYLQGRKPPGRGTTDDDYGEKHVLSDQISRLVFPLDITALVPVWRPPAGL